MKEGIRRTAKKVYSGKKARAQRNDCGIGLFMQSLTSEERFTDNAGYGYGVTKLGSTCENHVTSLKETDALRHRSLCQGEMMADFVALLLFPGYYRIKQCYRIERVTARCNNRMSGNNEYINQKLLQTYVTWKQPKVVADSIEHKSAQYWKGSWVSSRGALTQDGKERKRFLGAKASYALILWAMEDKSAGMQ